MKEIRQQILEEILVGQHLRTGPPVLILMLRLALQGHGGQNLSQEQLTLVQNDIAFMVLKHETLFVATQNNFNNYEVVKVSIESFAMLERCAGNRHVKIVFTEPLRWNESVLQHILKTGCFNNVTELGLALPDLDVDEFLAFQLHITMPSTSPLSVWISSVSN